MTENVINYIILHKRTQVKYKHTLHIKMENFSIEDWDSFGIQNLYWVKRLLLNENYNDGDFTPSDVSQGI